MKKFGENEKNALQQASNAITGDARQAAKAFAKSNLTRHGFELVKQALIAERGLKSEANAAFNRAQAATYQSGIEVIEARLSELGLAFSRESSGMSEAKYWTLAGGEVIRMATHFVAQPHRKSPLINARPEWFVANPDFAIEKYDPYFENLRLAITN